MFFSFYTALSYNESSAQEESQAQEEFEPTQGIPLPLEVEAGKITVDFKDAEIHDVLKIISYKSGVNIVAGQDVVGEVTIRLVNVHWERALDVILKNSGFVYERDEDIIRVTTLENLSSEELSTEIFVLNYADAQEVSAAIREMLSDRGRVKFDQRTNQLVVSDVPTNLYKISKVVGRLDKKTPQIMIEARVIETVLDEDENLGIDWTLGASATGSTRKTVFPFPYDRGYEKSSYFPLVNTSSSDFPGSGFPYAVKADFTFGALSFTQLQVVLEILKSRSDTKTLSNPRIVTLNNKKAEIHVGRDYGVPTYERNTSTGTMEVTGYVLRKVGVKLIVTPHVNAQGEIVIDLHPEVSSFLHNQTYGDIIVPVFSVREAITQVMVKDGETIVIGGLIKEETVEYVKKIPILGDLPLLKYIFSKSEKTVDTTDLMIFVTVRLLNSQDSDSTQQVKVSE